MTIKPNYDKSVKCWFCQKNLANKTEEQKRDYYRITGGTLIPAGYKYISCRVTVPCCDSCSSQHMSTIGAILAILFFLAPIVLLEVLYAEGFIHGLLLALVGGIGGSTLAYIVMKIDEAIRAPKLAKKGIKSASDVNEYPPIKVLLKYGFVDHKPDPDTHAAWHSDAEEESWEKSKDAFYRELLELSKQKDYIIDFYHNL